MQFLPGEEFLPGTTISSPVPLGNHCARWSTQLRRECWVATGLSQWLLRSARIWAWQKKFKPS